MEACDYCNGGACTVPAQVVVEGRPFCDEHGRAMSVAGWRTGYWSVSPQLVTGWSS